MYVWYRGDIGFYTISLNKMQYTNGYYTSVQKISKNHALNCILAATYNEFIVPQEDIPRSSNTIFTRYLQAL